MQVRSDPSKRRILFVEHNVDGTVGGSHCCLLDICRTLDRSRFQPVALFFQENSLLDDFRSAGAEVVVGCPTTRLANLSAAASARRSRLLSTLQSVTNAVLMLIIRPVQWLRFLRRHAVDIVHLNNSFNGNHDLMIAAWALRLPCIAHQRGVPGVTGRSEIWFGRRLARIVAISTFIRDDLLQRGLPHEKITLVHDGIDPSRTSVRGSQTDIASQLGIGPGRKVVGMVGNVKRWKGQHVFLSAMAMVAKRYPDVCGLVVGATPDPAYLAELKESILRLGLESNVFFAGYQRHSVDFMSLMDVVVHASVDPEPFGIVITEAMALGKPVIASDMGGPRDIVEPGVTGFLTPANDAEALSHKILALLDDPVKARKLGTAGSRRFLEHFTAARNVDCLQRLYMELTAKQ